MKKYLGILKFIGFHTVISFIAQMLCMTIQIPGYIKMYLICGIILLVVYLAAIYYMARKSEKHAMMFMETWKLLMIVTCLGVLVSENVVPLLTVVILTPFRPLILYNLKSGLYSIIAGLLLERLIELTTLRK